MPTPAEQPDTGCQRVVLKKVAVRKAGRRREVRPAAAREQAGRVRVGWIAEVREPIGLVKPIETAQLVAVGRVRFGRAGPPFGVQELAPARRGVQAQPLSQGRIVRATTPSG